MRCILEISLFKFTGDEIGVMRKKNPTDRYLENILPTYCIKPDGKAISSSGWLQFIDEGQEFYYGFSVIGAEGYLAQEIENLDFEFIIKEFGIDLSFLKDICRYGYEDSFHTRTGFEQLVFDVSYHSGYDHHSGGTEWESEIELVGYLNTDKELVKIEEHGKGSYLFSIYNPVNQLSLGVNGHVEFVRLADLVTEINKTLIPGKAYPYDLSLEVVQYAAPGKISVMVPLIKVLEVFSRPGKQPVDFNDPFFIIKT